MKLGKLEKVNIRKVWPKEDRDFTPWIEKHPEVIGDVIDRGIVDIESETNVGPFSADLVGTIEGTDKAVVIENQFGQTDHDHLGKLLTYMSGKEAKLGIWIAEKFRPEHLATLEYLNENTTEDGVSFFGIEVSAKKIGDSLPAAEFQVVVKPNAWKKQISQQSFSESTISRRKFRVDFYTRLSDAYKKAHPSWRQVKVQPSHWYGFHGTGTRGCALNWVFRSTGGHKFAVELYIGSSDKENNDYIFNYLFERKDKIEAEIGEKLDFRNKEDNKTCNIDLTIPISTVSTKLKRVEQEKIIDWGVTNMHIFSKVMIKYLKQMNKEN